MLYTVNSLFLVVTSYTTLLLDSIDLGSSCVFRTETVSSTTEPPKDSSKISKILSCIFNAV